MLARNAAMTWQPPEVGRGRFGEWLVNNIDWALSRDRYWGTPLPIWVCERDRSHVEAVGSYAELAERLGRALPDDFDPHKPYIDAYGWPCRRCGGDTGETRDAAPGATSREAQLSSRAPLMRRVPEVIDTWFDSGSMPFAQWHYPFENREAVARLYPADFICEGVDQTRGWFYSLLAIAAGLGDALPNNAGGAPAPYRAVVVNDLVLDADGVKMSKRLGNIVNPWEVVERHGADAVRIFLLAASQVWIPRAFDEGAIRQLATSFLLTLKNTYSGMFAQYANFGWEPSDRDPAPEHRPALDRWVLSRLASVSREVDALLERFEATQALRLVMDFVVDDLSNWYVRQSRARFYDVDGEDNRAAFATLHEVLVTVARLLAPFAPFLSDWIHRALTGSSVHLAPFAPAVAAASDPTLERGMSHVRTLARLGRAARDEVSIRVRQPLPRVVCVVPDAERSVPEELVALLAQELNVKRVEFASSGAAFVRLEARPSFRALGKRFGKRTPLAAQAVAALSDEALRSFERGEPVAISVEGEDHTLQPDDLEIVRRAVGDLVVEEEGGYFAALEPTVTPELRMEGVARELVSRIQRMRKDAGLAVSDRIEVHVGVGGGGDRGGAIGAVIAGYHEYISGEVLAVRLAAGGEPEGQWDAVQAVDLDGVPVTIAIRRKD
jgi:isoleucyl-tRNA synthetase